LWACSTYADGDAMTRKAIWNVRPHHGINLRYLMWTPDLAVGIRASMS
jgi:hypothetical protein